MKVVPDLYQLGTNTVENAQRVFAEQGLHVPDLDMAALEMLLTEASGQPQPIPLRLAVTLNDMTWRMQATNWARVIWCHSWPLAMHSAKSCRGVGKETTLCSWSNRQRRGRSFREAVCTSAAAAAAALGLVHLPAAPGSSEPEAFYAARVVRDGRNLPLRGFIDRDQLLLPVKEFAAEFGVDLQWDPELGAAVWDGRPLFGGRIIFDRAYMPHDRLAALLGVTIHWSPGDTVGEITVPKIVAGDESRGRLLGRR